jgi:hypothetical protein
MDLVRLSTASGLWHCGEIQLYVREKQVNPLGGTMKETISVLQILKNWMKLAVIVGILPWSYYYITSLAPIVNHALGVDHLTYIKIGFYLIPIMAPPLLLFSVLSKNDKD